MRAGILLLFCVGCGAVTHPTPIAYETQAYANPFLPGAAPPTHDPPPSAPPMPADPRSPVFAIDSSKIVLSTAPMLGVPTDEIGPVQELVWGGDEAAAAKALRERARAIGADAVVGVGLDVDPATHLTRMSGTAVRYRPLR